MLAVSSRIESKISSSPSSSAASNCPSKLFALDAKKLVGGNCLVSPAIITCLLLRIAPIASSGNICDASSKITISKLYVCASKKYDTDKGDIIKQGLIFKRRLGIVLNNFLIGIIRRFFPNSLVKILISS